jgi:hypothetical protein
MREGGGKEERGRGKEHVAGETRRTTKAAYQPVGQGKGRGKQEGGQRKGGGKEGREEEGKREGLI